MSEFIIADDHSDDEFGAPAAPATDAPIVLGAPAGGDDDDLFGDLSEEKPVVNEFGEEKPIVDDFSSALGGEFGAPAAAAAAAPMDTNDFGFSFVSEESPLR